MSVRFRISRKYCSYINPRQPITDSLSTFLGFSGDFCQHEDEDCPAEDACDNGQCQDLVASHKCLCMEGFTGDKYINKNMFCLIDKT